MKVNLGPYKSWFGPYQLAEALCFWVKKVPNEISIFEYPDWVHDFGTWLAEDKDGNDTWITKLCHWIESKRKRKVKIHIDGYDTWNMDNTLALIILPMLKQLKATKQGSPHVDPEDVPKELRSVNNEYSGDQKCFDFYIDSGANIVDIHARWDWVLNEIIWAFEQIVDPDDSDKFHTGNIEFYWIPLDENNNPLCEGIENTTKWKKENPELAKKVKNYEMVRGPNDTSHFDFEAYKAHHVRIHRGTTLFGKYYHGLWD
jgi:hypothetical protein